ncbi:MAG: methylated-DNA--[protein]-cysteine S-methyltransferase [Planctomycetia bacterium]|nr:methylated-DNA--[protein]-cysteine S-methyltransferase [Planctomycetia bacterium]
MGFPVVCSQAEVFPTRLGWIALAGHDALLAHVSFGHRSADAAWGALHKLFAQFETLADADPGDSIKLQAWNVNLQSRMQAFAEGEAVDFSDVALDVAGLTPFAQRVVRHCRKVPYGETRSYRELAVRAGSPGAARAVGSVMARNRWPLVVPCHRIVASGSGIGGFSAPGGVGVKRRLLEMEAAALAKVV